MKISIFYKKTQKIQKINNGMVNLYFMSRVFWRQLISKSNVLVTLVIEVKGFLQKEISIHLKNSFWHRCKWFSVLVSRINIINFFRMLGQCQLNAKFQTSFYFPASWHCKLNIIIFLRKIQWKVTCENY